MNGLADPWGDIRYNQIPWYYPTLKYGTYSGLVDSIIKKEEPMNVYKIERWQFGKWNRLPSDYNTLQQARDSFIYLNAASAAVTGPDDAYYLIENGSLYRIVSVQIKYVSYYRPLELSRWLVGKTGDSVRDVKTEYINAGEGGIVWSDPSPENIVYGHDSYGVMYKIVQE
jgi:hypothetical protein